MKKPIKNGKEVFAVLSMATVMSISMSVKADAASTESKKDLAAESAYTATIINDVATSGYTSGIETSPEIKMTDIIDLRMGLDQVEPPLSNFGAETDELELGKERIPFAQQATNELNYAEDEKNVGTYKETQLE